MASRRLPHGKMKKLTPEDRLRREARNQRRGRVQKIKGMRPTKTIRDEGTRWSLPQIVEEQRESHMKSIKRKLGLSD